MDAIQAHQAGFTNVVAQMGTALTEPQLKQLSKYARRLILALDPDTAGVKATMRGLDVARQTLGDSSVVFDPKGIMRQASKLDVEIMVMTLPEDQDPDDLIRDDPAAWQRLIDTAQSVADYVIAAGTSHLTPQTTFSEREQIARQLLPILIATENDLQQHYNIQRLALRLRLDERTLIEWVQQQARITRQTMGLRGSSARPKSGTAAPNQPPTPAFNDPGNSNSGLRSSEGYCLAMIIRESRLLATANRKFRELAAQIPETRESLGRLSTDDWSRTEYRAIFDTLLRALAQDDLEPLEYLRQHLPFELAAELDRLLSDPLDTFKQNLHPSMHAQFEVEVDATRKKKEWTSAGNEETEFIQRILDLRKQSLRRNNQELSFLIQEADPDSQLHYNHQFRGTTQAIKVIEQAVKAMAQLQRTN
jgi:DNA primase